MSSEPSSALLEQSLAHLSNIYYPNDTVYYLNNTEARDCGGRGRIKLEMENEKMKK